jgi:hypothetical protein
MLQDFDAKHDGMAMMLANAALVELVERGEEIGVQHAK